MDPAFLIWIPPIEETSLDDEPQYEEIPEKSPELSDDGNVPKHRKSLSNIQQQEEIKSLLAKSPKSSESIELRKTPGGIEITDNRMAEYYGLSDIQFADDGDELDEEVRYIDENKAHHSSNRLSETRYSKV